MVKIIDMERKMKKESGLPKIKAHVPAASKQTL